MDITDKYQILKRDMINHNQTTQVQDEKIGRLEKAVSETQGNLDKTEIYLG